MRISPGGSDFHPSRSNLRPPQIVSCNDASNRIGCIPSTNPSCTARHQGHPLTPLDCNLDCQQGSFDLAAQLLTHDNAFDAVDLLSTFEEDQGGDTIYVPLTGQFLVLIDVQLGECYTFLVLFAHCLKLWERVTFAKLNVDQNEELTSQWNIDGECYTFLVLFAHCLKLWVKYLERV